MDSLLVSSFLHKISNDFTDVFLPETEVEYGDMNLIYTTALPPTIKMLLNAHVVSI